MSTSTVVPLHSDRASAFLARVGVINAWISGRFVLAMLAVAAVAIAVPSLGHGLRTMELLPLGGGWTIDVPSLALAFMMLSASLGSRVSDFRQLVERPTGSLLCLITYYVAAPLLTGVCALGVASFFGGDRGVQLCIGLMLTIAMPVARTASIWVQRTQGNMPLLLAMITLTTGLAALSAPLYLDLLSVGNGFESTPAASLLPAFLVSVIAPVALGMSVRAFAPASADRWQPLASLLGTVGLWVAVAANAAVAGPFLRTEGPFLVAMAVLTIATNAIAFGFAIGLARLFRLPQEDAITFIFASGMRSNGTSLVLGLKAFPTLPLVTFPSAVYIIAQHALASVLARMMLRPDGRLLGPSVGVSRSALELRIASARSATRRRSPRHALMVLALAHEDGRPVDAYALACKLRRELRSCDYVATVSPTAVAALLSDTSPSMAQRAAHRLTAHVKASVQAGIATAPILGDGAEHGALIDQLLTDANAALSASAVHGYPSQAVAS